MANNKQLTMTTAPVQGLVVSLALPSMAIMIVSALYNMADTYWVSSLGTSVVAAVGIAFPLMGVIQAMGFFFGQGSGNYMSRALGARDEDNASRMAITGLISAFLLMMCIAVVCIIFLQPLVMGLGATDTIAPYAKTYIFYILLASPWMVAATVLNLQLRFQGSASVAMVGMISGTVLNIFLDPVFIYPLKMGIAGAAVATMASQILSFSILLFYGTTRGSNIRLKFRYFSPSPARYLEMFRGGVPALLRQGLMAVSTIVINQFANIYGDAAIAAISIVQRIGQFSGALIMGFGQGFQPVCGFNYGAKKYRRVKQAFWFSARIMVSGMACMAVLLAVFAPQVIGFFRKDPDVLRIGVRALRLACLSMWLIPWIVINNMATQTMGMAAYASLLAVARQGLYLLPALVILDKLCGFGLGGILVSQPVSDFCAALTSLPICLQVMTKILKEHDTHTA